MDMRLQIVFQILFLISVSNLWISAQDKTDSLTAQDSIGNLQLNSISYFDYKLREFALYEKVTTSINLLGMTDYGIKTRSLSDLNFAMSLQYKLNFKDDLKTFKTILGGIGAAAAVTLGTIHLMKYGNEYFKRNKKD